MESYSQPWTVVNKHEQYQSEPKTYEYYAFGGVDAKKPQYETVYNKPEQYGNGKYEKTTEQYGNGNKYEQYRNGGKYETEQYRNGGKYETEQYRTGGKMTEQFGKYEKPEQYGNKYDQYYYKGENKPEQYGKYEKTEQYYYKGEKPVQHYKQAVESICGGEWEKVCNSLERCQLERPSYESRLEIEQTQKPRYRCGGLGGNGVNTCCDEEMVKLVKEMINILLGAEQSYIQLGFLCMDEKFTLVNTSEYFRLCGLRMRWLANGLIAKSVRLFNVNEWINQTTFENYFKVPTKEELATNDYTSIIKTFFKIAMDCEGRLVARMNVLGDKMMKTDWVNTECRFEGFKWFVNFVLPYQAHFVREMTGHSRNIEMCDNGFIFDKCEMYPLVQKIEEFIHQITKINTCGGVPVWQKQHGIVPINKRW